MVEPCLYFIACTAILYYHAECHINRKTYIIHPMVELYPRFTMSIRSFNIITCNSVLIVDMTSFNLWLNRIHVLRYIRHILYYC